MSELCPCESQLKLNDCCISEDIAAIKKKFVGNCVFPERVDWAIGYLEYKAINNKQIVVAQEGYAKSIGEEITCKEKCSECCLEFIAARLEECDAIAIYLYFYPDIMNKFLRNFDLWQQRITADDNILKKISAAHQKTFETRDVEDRKRFEDMALQYAQKHAYCPFLENDKCLIYPVRPYTCSVYSVISDKKYCAPVFSKEVYIKNKLKVRSTTNPLYFDTQYYIDLKGLIPFGPLQKGIYNILKYGPPSSNSGSFEAVFRT